MLSDRRQRVLSALIEEYVERAMPVGSRTLTERYQLGVSPATVRNDLSALEDAGYITQPHTSAGRIPTDAGYRAFVDELLSHGLAAEEHPHRDIVDELRASASELDALMEQTSAALARLTDCLSIVMAPSFSAHIRQLSLISLSNYRALIVIVAEDGRVANRSVAFAEEVTPDELAGVQNLLGRLFAGKSVRELREGFDAPTYEALRDPLVQLILDEVIACLQENNIGRAHRLGMSSLLRKPEFSSSSALLPLVQVLEDDSVLLHVFDEASAPAEPAQAPDDAPGAEGEHVMVRIGRENAAVELSGVSVIASTYGRGEGEGIVAVIGPTRMDYTRVIRAVRAAQHVLRDE
ncbi:heat-inducible transcriptional repressor HrcA [Adlercreutzia sp. ZJ242]|uniref:heat-inducible transcriptional repressor HrcA n=1 Tax=Adlercreutzia sp. ZJ242 TaxID=2709409 RepID=UPI0013EA7CA5|nr:heat-inducible transcriptional repressor HrcA [Adlercreutzia sp. ZJ242]